MIPYCFARYLHSASVGLNIKRVVVERAFSISGFTLCYVSFSDYYQTRRLDMAKLLILEKKLKINQIAETLNYSSLYSFSKAFKSKYGGSPSRYLDKND